MFSTCRRGVGKPLPPPRTDVMLSMERTDFEMMFRNKRARNALIQKVSGAGEAQADNALYLRFCASADEYADTENKMERTQKARKIVCTFIQPGSMFQLPNIPHNISQGLLEGKFELLSPLRNLLADILTKDSFVNDAVLAIPPIPDL